MTARSMPWFEDYDPRDVRRWGIAAAIVVFIHLAAIGTYVYSHRPDQIGDESSPVAVDFAPADDTVDQVEQPEQPPPPDQPPPPPPPQPEAAVPLPEVKPVEQAPPPPPPPPAQQRSSGGAATVSAPWEAGLVKHLQRYKRYPSDAQSRGEEGIVLLSFSVDRNGHVLAHQIVKSSGHPDLDEEANTMIERAQPLPPFPSTMAEATLDLTVPIRFSLR